MNPVLPYKLIGAAVLALLLFAGGAYSGYHWEHGALLKAQQADADFTLQQVELRGKLVHAQDQISAAVSTKQAAAQAQVITRVKTIIERIPVHVTNNVACVSYGFIRLLNSAAGPRAYSVPDAASEPDNSCSSVTWRQLANDLIEDYGRADQNAVELNGLQDWVKQQAAASQGASPQATPTPP